MTFNEWEESRKEALATAQKNIAILEAQGDSELGKLFGDSFETALAEEVREYTKAISITSIEEDLFQIAVLLKELKEELKKTEPKRKTGHWIPRNSYLLKYRCSECERESEKYDYCPNCGAKMEWTDDE